MRKRLVAGNWKMNGTQASIATLTSGVLAGLRCAPKVEVWVCPPYVYLAQVVGMLQGSTLKLGAQDLSERAPGAYTGDICAEMLVDVGCYGVIIGHSERRSYHGESDGTVAQKMVAAHRQGLVPMVCVGETLEQRESEQTEAVIARQLGALLAIPGGMAALKTAVIAYEPVWAIGTGRTATPQQAQAVHKFIRGQVALRDASLAAKMQILYGGSVKPDNAGELFAMDDIDGGLIGGASLAAADFLAICEAANSEG